MIEPKTVKPILLVVGALALSGCVAAVPVQSTLTVIPGQGKTEANLRADDTACRGAPATTGAATAAATALTSEQYYACMASKGEAVIEQQTQVYPTYAAYSAYGYPAYAYGYPYPYGGYYPYPYGYGYPYDGYFGPYVGFGIGFGYGGFYGRGWRGGYGYGGYRGGYGGYGGLRGGYGGGFHGGGGFRR